MRKNGLIIGIILLIVLFERLLSCNTSLFKQLELFTYDFRAKIAIDNGPFKKKFKHADQKIVLLNIDDITRVSLSKNPQLKLGSWPWRRDIWADVLDFIEKGKPKMVLFDLLFNDLNENSQRDKSFAQSLKKYDNVIIATSLNNPKSLVDIYGTRNVINSQYLPTKQPLIVKIDSKKIDDSITWYSHASVSDLYTKSTTIAVANAIKNDDDVIRVSQPIFKLIKNGKTYYMPSLAFAGFLKYMGEDDNIAIKNFQIFYKNRIIPINDNGQTYISWHGKGSEQIIHRDKVKKKFNKKHELIYDIPREMVHNYPQESIINVLLSMDGKLSIKDKRYITFDYFKDKIIIIGHTESGTDYHATPVKSIYPGPEINATALDNFINDTIPHGKNVRKFIAEIPPVTAFILIVMLCLLITFIGIISKNAILGFANSLALILLYILICILAFAYPTIRLWIPMIVPLYYSIMTSALVFAFRFQKETAKKASIMNMFGKFVSPKVLSTLLKNEDNLVLKSTRKRITVMFCDIKNFTTLSEKCNPEQLVDNLNELFNEIVNVIFENNGTVDKFIGDCIMAYWGDPIASDDDAYMAVKTALDIKKKVKELAIQNAKENKIIFDVKIGINTGEALLGLSGSQKIMSYTAMGDAVNVASRLESNCSKLNRDILISKSTYEDARSKISVLEAGKINVKGRDEQIEIYEPVEVKGVNEGVNEGVNRETNGGENVVADYF